MDIARSEWTRAWARRVLGSAYDDYLQSKDEKTRAENFTRLWMRLSEESRRRKIAGSQVLDLLGPPALWASDLGNTRLIYFYYYEKVRKEIIIDVDSSGDISLIGFNTAGVNQWGPSYHH